MDDFQRKALKSWKDKGLLDAKGTQAVLRRLLPSLERLAEAGRSNEELMQAAEEYGLKFGSIGYFRNALYRARKAGPITDDLESPATSAARQPTPAPHKEPATQAQPVAVTSTHEPAPKRTGPVIAKAPERPSTVNAKGGDMAAMLGDQLGKI